MKPVHVGGIPIIRTLEEYYDNEDLKSISGIFNGSSNFILSKIYNQGLSYNVALKQAQDLGFAETDPTLDVQGFDPKYKLIILALHAYGIVLKPEQIFNSGIDQLGELELELYKTLGIKIKLNPILQKSAQGKLCAYVIPQLVNDQHKLAHVNNEYNAVIVEGSFSDEQLFIGKGAGGHPTGAAVLSDISALSYDYKYEYKKYFQNSQIGLDNSREIPVYLSGTKSALEKLFNETEIAQTGQGSFVVAIRSIQWLIDHQPTLRANQIFLSKIHEEVFHQLDEYYQAIKTEVYA
jgi:homoserine dehydrogenase